jgi:hypothetical protein
MGGGRGWDNMTRAAEGVAFCVVLAVGRRLMG